MAVNEVSTKHPHEPEIEPIIDAEGRCLVCSRLHWTAEADRWEKLAKQIERERDELQRQYDNLSTGYVPPHSWPQEAWRVLLGDYLEDPIQLADRYVLYRLPPPNGTDTE